jgi:hypothetical protein
MKESLQLQYNSNTSAGKFPSSSDVPGFISQTKSFMLKCHDISLKVMRMFALGLGMEEEWFTKHHDIENEESMSTLRMIHYHDTKGIAAPRGYWRAGYLLSSVLFLGVDVKYLALIQILMFSLCYSNERTNPALRFAQADWRQRPLRTGIRGTQ